MTPSSSGFLLAIDVGNTNSVFALYDGERLLGVWRMITQAERSADEYAVFLKTVFAASGIENVKLRGAILGSVVPAANFHICSVCHRYFGCEPLVVGSPDVVSGLRIKIDRPEELGADRLINAVAGLASYTPPFLIVDFGTATTFDLIDEEGEYCGGAIAPGINLSLQALHSAAAKLPRVAVAKPSRVIGTATVPALQSGIFWGYVSLIEGLIARIKQEYAETHGGRDDISVIATGGLSSLFKDSLPVLKAADCDLTLRGLRLLFEKNERQNKQ